VLKTATRTITNHYRDNPDLRPQVDVVTRSLMQQAAFRCRVLGTFVEDENGDLEFGKDVDAVYAAADYVVAKPYGESLQAIVDHVELPMGEREGEYAGDEPPNAGLPDTDSTIVIGKLRYASSRRRERIAAQDHQATEVEVRVRPKDFVAHKTAVFGMTRAGKSNTMKVLASAVHLYARQTGTRVGQRSSTPSASMPMPTVRTGPLWLSLVTTCGSIASVQPGQTGAAASARCP
jgi:Helicase HerA, central domain